MTKKRGRPTKLNADMQQRIVEAVRLGYYLSNAAKLAGIARASLFLWLKKSETERSWPSRTSGRSHRVRRKVLGKPSLGSWSG